MAVDYFLKLDTVDGESTSKGNEKQIQVQSWSWGAANVSTVSGTGGSGAGKADVADISMMIELDKSFPKLLQGLTKGTHFKTADFSANKTGSNNKPYLVMKLTEVFVTSLQMSASSEVPSVSLSLSFATFELTYSTQDTKGVLTAAGTAKYDRLKNVTA